MEITIPKILVTGELNIPSKPKAIIILIHGSGSNRFTSRIKFISKNLNTHGYGTLKINLLTDEEIKEDQVKNHLRFDIGLLTHRLIAITEFLIKFESTKNFPLGYFSSSSGTAAAINAAIRFKKVKAIVSRGGRLDLVHPYFLSKHSVPILFIIGDKDYFIIKTTKKNYKKIPKGTFKDIAVIPNATHFFDEPGALKKVLELSIGWFDYHLSDPINKFENPYTIKLLSFSQLFRNFKIRLKIRDRVCAGSILSNSLKDYKNNHDAVIIGIPRGGFIVANSLANRLGIKDLKILVVKRLRDPHNYENAIGAITHDDVRYLNFYSKLVSHDYLLEEIIKQKNNIKMESSYYALNQFMDYNLLDRPVILVDDGVHTGSSIICACRWLRAKKPSKIIAALPIISKQKIKLITKEVDRIEYIYSPTNMDTVEDYYHDFHQVNNFQMNQILRNQSTYYNNIYF